MRTIRYEVQEFDRATGGYVTVFTTNDLPRAMERMAESHTACRVTKVVESHTVVDCNSL